MTRPRYCEQETRQTLREGVDEYFGFFGEDLSQPSTFEARNAPVMLSHDVAHVIFGCTTDIRDELFVELWTFLGTSVPFDRPRPDLWEKSRIGYLRALGAAVIDFGRDPTTRSISADLARSGFIGGIVRYRRELTDIVKRARRMHEKWPWGGFEPLLDEPLAALRRRFGIEVMPAAGQ